MGDPIAPFRGPALMQSTCIVCEHPVRAMSEAARDAAIQNHVEYVNTRLDRATDPHFEDGRLLALVES